MAEFKSSELTLNDQGCVYHLNVKKGNLAKKIILVGDQDRVKLVGSFFDEITFKTQHREFATITGVYKGVDISVVSHGIGCDNIDIVLNEIDAVFNFDLEHRTVKDNLTSLKFIRIGTCGALQEDIKVGTAVISKYAIGMDGVANFYDIPASNEIEEGLAQFQKESNWPNDLVIPYLASANKELVNKLDGLGQEGITITANGFYGPQGRALRIPLKHPDFKEAIRGFKFDNVQVSNFEMETSALLALSSVMGHKATTICLVLANRYNNTFESNFDKKMEVLIQNVLDRFID